MNICIVVSEIKYVRLIYLLSQIVIYIIYQLLHVLMQTKKKPDSAKRGNHFQGTFFFVCDMKLRT